MAEPKDPREVRCEWCHASPGAHCTVPEYRGGRKEVLWYHYERQVLARKGG